MGHCRTLTFDRPMILLDDVVEVAALADHDRPPTRIFFTEQPYGAVTGRVPIQIDLAGPPRLRSSNGLSQESLRRRHGALAAQE